jgi:hypothetical protein
MTSASYSPHYWGVTAEFLLAHTSTVILGAESHGTQDHILRSDSPESLQISKDSLLDMEQYLYFCIW